MVHHRAKPVRCRFCGAVDHSSGRCPTKSGRKQKSVNMFKAVKTSIRKAPIPTTYEEARSSWASYDSKNYQKHIMKKEELKKTREAKQFQELMSMVETNPELLKDEDFLRRFQNTEVNAEVLNTVLENAQVPQYIQDMLGMKKEVETAPRKKLFGAVDIWYREAKGAEHTQVWGSYFVNGRWGYICCKSCDRESRCVC
ncbi:hypothetical protein PCE1_004061 [Barthelona sp. PCE]